MDNIGVIIQARTGSTRLPSKMVIPFYEEKGILEILIERLKKANITNSIIVATTKSPNDNAIVSLAERHNCLVFRGSEHNVLERFIEAAKSNGIDKIIRVCADNPFLDTNYLKNMIKVFAGSDVDYLCYSLSTGKPTILTHYGFWAEGVSLKALKKVQQLTNEKLYLEHVTNYIYTYESDFSLERIKIPEYIEKTNLRLTIDTQEDFDLAIKVYNEVKNKEEEIDTKNIVNIVKENKEWLNAMEKQIKLNTK